MLHHLLEPSGNPSPVLTSSLITHHDHTAPSNKSRATLPNPSAMGVVGDHYLDQAVVTRSMYPVALGLVPSVWDVAYDHPPVQIHFASDQSPSDTRTSSNSTSPNTLTPKQVRQHIRGKLQNGTVPTQVSPPMNNITTRLPRELPQSGQGSAMTAASQGTDRAHLLQFALVRCCRTPNEPGAELLGTLTGSTRGKVGQQQQSTTLGTNPTYLHTETNTHTSNTLPSGHHTLGKSRTFREMGKGRPHRVRSGGPKSYQCSRLGGPQPAGAASQGHAIRPSNGRFP